MDDKITPVVLQSNYFTVFSGDAGQNVLNDIKVILTGAGLDEYEEVHHSLPHAELAARTATRNAWDMIDGFTREIPRKKLSFWWLVKETYRIWKYSRKLKRKKK